MKVITANGKKRLKMSKKEWFALGKKAKWLSKEAQYGDDLTEEDIDAMLREEGLDPAALEEEVAAEEAAFGTLPEESLVDEDYVDPDLDADILEEAQMKQRERNRREQERRQQQLQRDVYSKPPIA